MDNEGPNQFYFIKTLQFLVQVLISVSIAFASVVQTNKLPIPPPVDDTMLGLGQRPRLGEPSFYLPERISPLDWDLAKYHVDNRREEVNAIANDEENAVSEGYTSVDKRLHANEPKTATLPQRNHWDICFVSQVKDLGHHFYPRFIETANCNTHFPPNLQRHIKCAAIHYHVQVLTQRKDTDPVEDEDTHRLPLPDSLANDWRFVSIPVNVGCHCVSV